MGSALTKLWILAILGALIFFLLKVHVHLVVCICATGLALGLIAMCARFIPKSEVGDYQGGLVTFLGARSRSVGPGLCFLFQPLGIPIETIPKLVPLTDTNLTSRRHFTLKSNEQVLLEVTITYRPRAALLWEFCEFSQEARDVRIKREVENLIGTVIRAKEHRRDVENHLLPIYESVQDEFNRVNAPTYGVSAIVLIAIPKTPVNLAEG